MDLTGASALVTGGASGIGEASARQLAAKGARCVIVDLNEEKGEAVAKDIGGLFAKADVADEGQVQAAVDAATEMGPLRPRSTPPVWAAPAGPSTATATPCRSTSSSS